MMAFDATSRESCTVRRGRSNTPPQALVTLNDPVHVEAVLTALHAKAKAKYAADAKLATQLVGNADPDAAAWAVVANVVLNLDEMLMKR